jgi:hypothetical protein
MISEGYEPAFPCLEIPVYEGMTLRDYFAAEAMQGLFAMNAHPGSCGINENEYQAYADRSYLMADAMLKARGEA